MRLLRLVLILGLLVSAAVVCAQEAPKQAIDASTMAKANNPLADMNAFNLHNYYSPSLYSVPNQTANTMFLRGIMVAGRQIIRATLPFSTAPTGLNSSISGIGDLVIFDAIVITGKESPSTIGVGPLLVCPTASDDALGANDTWQGGAAFVAVKPIGMGNIVGGLVTWQTDFAGGDERIDTNVMTAQCFLTMNVGGGWYIRSSPLALLDFENDRYLVPLGLGVGKVLKLGGAVVNVFIEPQPTVYYKGGGMPAMQVFVGMNFQFLKQ